MSKLLPGITIVAAQGPHGAKDQIIVGGQRTQHQQHPIAGNNFGPGRDSKGFSLQRIQKTLQRSAQAQECNTKDVQTLDKAYPP